MKKFTSMVVALLLVVTMAVPVFAEETEDAVPAESVAEYQDNNEQEGITDDQEEIGEQPEQHVHEWSDWCIEAGNEATCTSPGARTRYCQDPDCDETEIETIPKLSHKWVNSYVAAKATIRAAGTQVQRCEYCGATRNVAIAKLRPFISWKHKVAKLQRKKSAKFTVNLANGDYVKKWKSSKKGIATVSKSGVVKAKKNGKTKITAYTASGLKITCTVKVVKPAKKKKAKKTGKVVYWTPGGAVYHSTINCSTLARSKTIYEGTIAESGKKRGCKVCY